MLDIRRWAFGACFIAISILAFASCNKSERKQTTVDPNGPVEVVMPEHGAYTGAFIDFGDEEDTVNFAALSGVRPMIETYPLEKAGEAYARMMSGKAQFRVVLTI